MVALNAETQEMTVELADSGALEALHAAIVRQWPEHRKVIDRNLDACSERARRHAAETAELIARIAGRHMDRLVEGYRWMCGMMQEEELFFQRENRYRRTSFEEAYREVYARPEIMGPYMDGLLVSQAVWSSHIRALEFFIQTFLAGRRPGGRYLEIGPGHGLLLYFAARGGAPVEGWDVSDDSLRHSGECVARLDVANAVRLVRRNLFDDLPQEKFDDIVLSEVLEHLEFPAKALEILRELLSPSGRLFINAPVNSPTIDHISLFRTPEEIVSLAENSRLKVIDMLVAPAAGYTEERARRLNSAMSCSLIVQRADL
jgi:2-polyprenyl-3-methyl-5-hydroxy-6-metoxy-1,4-benzoquinol methylase